MLINCFSKHTKYNAIFYLLAKYVDGSCSNCNFANTTSCVNSCHHVKLQLVLLDIFRYINYIFTFFFPKNHVLLEFVLDITGYKFILFLLILLNLNIH